MKRDTALATLLWALGALLAAVIIAHARYSADLSAFLPRQPSAAQRLLVEQLKSGPGARLILMAISGADSATRARLSAQLAQALRADARFASISNGDAAGLERDRDYLFAHRYLLSPQVTPARFSSGGLRAAIDDSLDLLTSPAGALLKPVFTRDPTGEFLAILTQSGVARAPATADGVWSSPDGARALLMAQTRAQGSDTDAQQAAIEAIHSAFARVTRDAAASRARLALSGPPVFAVNSRALIKGEVLRLSGLSAALVALLLLFVYRSGAALLLTLVPVASGALAGVAAVALGFPAVHGITLGFGVTLIGEAVDYSIYLFVQRRPGWQRSVWPTIRLGMLTSVCGFAALLPSAFTGLAQLGLYSVTGLLAAGLVTRYVLPRWLPADFAIRDLSRLGAWLEQSLAQARRYRTVLAIVPLVAVAVLLSHRGAFWNRELQALSPLSRADQDFDERLRADVAAPDFGYVIVVSAAERELALAQATRVGARLEPLIEQGVIGGYQSPARYLPAQSVQRARQASLPPPALLRARLAEALAGAPLSAERLEPFLSDVERARSAALLRAADLDGTSMSAAGALLTRNGSGWAALLPLAAAGGPDLSPAALAAVRATLAGTPEASAVLLDLKGEADALYAGYLTQGAALASAGLLAIVVLLTLVLRSFWRVLRVIAPLLLAVLVVVALLVALGKQLTLLHLVGMLLVLAVGSNYALFFDRSAEHGAAVALTLASLLVANLATVLTFGVLAASRVQLLADLGSVVAPGTLLALGFAALLARTPRVAG
jgi:predicted exporter